MIKDLGVVARDGIEPSTRGFSVRRSPTEPLSKRKKGKGARRRRPSRAPRPSPCRASFGPADQTPACCHARQRVAAIATERGPNRGRAGVARNLYQLKFVPEAGRGLIPPTASLVGVDGLISNLPERPHRACMHPSGIG